MNPSDFNDEQKADINERIAKAQVALKELQLHPSVAVQSVNVGDDVFAQRVIPYLQDEKYTSVPSPIQP